MRSKKVKLVAFCLSITTLVIVPTIASSCAYVRPNFKIFGDGGACFADTPYYFFFKYKGLYVSNIKFEDFSFEFYNDDNNDLGQQKSSEWVNAIFKPFTRQDIDFNTGKITLITNGESQFDTVPHNEDFFMKILVNINQDLFYQTVRHFSFDMGEIDFSIGLSTKPQDYYSGDDLPTDDDDWNSWTVIDPDYAGDGSAYIYEGSDELIKKTIMCRLKSDFVQECINTVAATSNITIYGMPISVVDSPNTNLKFTGHYAFDSSEFTNFRLTGLIDCKISIFNITINIDLEFIGTYVIGGAYNARRYEQQHTNPAINGNYWSLYPKDPIDANTGALTHVEFDANLSGFLPMDIRWNDYSQTETFLLEKIGDWPMSFKCQSYFLSKITKIEPITIKSLSYDKSYYVSHPEDVPKFIQKDEPNTNGFYRDVDNWSRSMFWYYRDKSNPPSNDYEPVYDLTDFINSNTNEGSRLIYKYDDGVHAEPVLGLPWQSNHELWWNSVDVMSQFKPEFKNNCPDASAWNNKPYYFIRLDNVFKADGTPYWCPDPWDGQNDMYSDGATSPCDLFFAYPSDINLDVVLL